MRPRCGPEAGPDLRGGALHARCVELQPQLPLARERRLQRRLLAPRGRSRGRAERLAGTASYEGRLRDSQFVSYGV